MTQQRRVKVRAVDELGAMEIANALLKTPAIVTLAEELQEKGRLAGEVETTDVNITLEQF